MISKAHWQDLWGTLTTPQAVDVDEARREYMTRVISLIMALVASGLMLIFATGWLLGFLPFDSVFITLGMTLAFGGAWWLAYRGQWRAAGYIPPTIIFLTAVYGNWIGGAGAPAMVLYALAIVLTAILQGEHAQWITLVFSIAAYLAIGWALISGYIVQLRFPETAFANRVVVVVGGYVSLASLLWFLIHEFRRALAQIRVYADRLAVANRQLEHEISVRQQADESLRQSNEALQALVDCSPLAIVKLDLAGQVLLWNQAAEELYGWTRAEVLGEFIPMIPEKHLPEYQDILARLLKGETLINLEVERQRKDGALILVDLSMAPLRDAHGAITAFMSIVGDITESHQAKVALYESEQRFRLFMQHFPGLAYIKDAATHVLFANQGFMDYLNIDPAAILDKTNHDIFPPEFAEQMTADDGSVLESGVSKVVEERYAGRVWSTYKFVIPQTDKTSLLGGFTLDISERKRVQEMIQLRLRLAEFAATHSLGQLLQKTLDEICALTNSPIGFYHFVEADQRTLSLQAWSTRTLAEFCTAEGDGLHYAIDQAGVWTDCVRERRPVIHNDYASLPYRKGLPDGHAQVIRELVVPILRGDRIVAILGVGNRPQNYTDQEVELVSYVADLAWEITEHKRAEEESVALAKFPSENPYPILRLDRDGVVLYANKASLGLLADWGCADGERVPEYWRDLVTEALATQTIQMVETHSGGRIYSVSMVPIVDANYVNLYGDNITERKQVESQREELIRELEAKNAELERFTYTVSHDLKSPLVTIRGFLGLLEKDALAGNTERVKADTARITEATRKMLQLLNELLELSRIGRLMNPPELLPFNVIVQGAVELLHGQIEARGAQVILSSDLPVVYGDRIRLIEVMQNLVDNACKFMGDQAEPRITIGQRGIDHDGKPILFVQDNGMGIDPRYHEKVFGLFDKLDAQGEGTGVGLALVKRIVEVHGGRIWVESAGNGQGTTFLFTLPLKPALNRVTA
jgi:PAS domain S-box-containing protein